MSLLTIDRLRVAFSAEEGLVRAVDGVSLRLERGEVLAIVGESGCGKSALVTAIMGLNRREAHELSGSVLFDGTELTAADEARLRELRGARLAMIFQDPLSSLNPVQRLGDQVAEGISAHTDCTRAEASSRAVAMLERLGLPRPAQLARSYPHELSGGMRQRAMIAMALSCAPDVLLADEPTTALDVTTQAQILEHIRDLARQGSTGVIIVTHDLGVVVEIADRVAVMYAGRIVEEGTLDEVFYDPQHPYTWGLLGSISTLEGPRAARLRAIPGLPPSLADLPSGCHFRPRCPHEFDRCPEVPALVSRNPAQPGGHRDRCWLSPEDKRTAREDRA